MSKQLITEGTVTIKGTNAAGQSLEVTADIKGLDVEVKRDVEYLDSWWSISSNRPIVTRQDFTFHLNIKDTYTVKAKNSKVEKSARVLGWTDEPESELREPTIALIKQAATLAGVDENTSYTLEVERGGTRPCYNTYVTFRWTE